VKSAYPDNLSNPFPKGVAVAYPADDAIIEDNMIWSSDKSRLYFVPYDYQGVFTILNSVTAIGNDAFNGCTQIDELNIEDCDTELTIGTDAFKNVTPATAYLGRNLSSIIFSGNANLKTITIGKCVTKLAENAFLGCTALEKVNITDIAAWCNISFTNAYGNPTYYTHSLCLNGEEITNLVIPETVKAIKFATFWGCEGITSVTLPDSLESIRKSAFNLCSNLSEINIPNSVTTIGAFAFGSCTSLTDITIPSSVTTMGSYVFKNCSNLNSLTFEDGEEILTIGNSNANDLWTTPTIETLYLGRNISFSGDQYGPFDSNSNLKSVVIGETVNKIYDYCFYKCTGLTSVTIPESVTEIGAYAFFENGSLKSITIPASVTAIGSKAFYGNENVTFIESKAATPPAIKSDTFLSYSAMLLAAGEGYRTADYWKNFTDVATEYTPTGTVFEVDGFKYEVSSVNDLTCRLYAFDESITGEDVVVPETVEYRNRTFTPTEIKGILLTSDSAVKSFTIPGCVTNIASGIIWKSSLEKLIVNTPVTTNLPYLSSIGELVIAPTATAFSADLHTNSVGKITIEDSETPLTTSTFKCETGEVYLGRNVSASAFYGMDSLCNLTISDKVTSISSSAFEGCSNVSEIFFPNSVNYVGSSAFSGCSGISSLTFENGENNLTLGTDAFKSALPSEAYFGRQMNFAEAPVSALETVEFGENVTSIENGAFKSATALRSVTSRNTVPPTTDDTFSDKTYLDGTLYVPAASVKAYQDAAGWKGFWEIDAFDGTVTGISEIGNDSGAQVSVANGAICVGGDAQVRIVAMNGTTVYSGRANISVNVAPGVYVVVVGNTATKVAVK
jgi:hypothetical protein